MDDDDDDDHDGHDTDGGIVMRITNTNMMATTVMMFSSVPGFTDP